MLIFGVAWRRARPLVGYARKVVSAVSRSETPTLLSVGEGSEYVKIILANPRGFCAGVNMAIESLDRALELFGTPLYVYHEIVHNRYVVERFRQRGVVFVDDVADIPSGSTV